MGQTKEHHLKLPENTIVFPYCVTDYVRSIRLAIATALTGVTRTILLTITRKSSPFPILAGYASEKKRKSKEK